MEVHYPVSLSSNKPTRAGTVWYKSTRDFISDHANEVRLAGAGEINGIATKILEWDVPAKDRRPFNALPYTRPLLKGGKLRLFVSPQLGYVVSRVEFSDRLGITHGRLDFSDFREVADGLHFPFHTELALGGVESYQINRAEKINEEIQDTEFAPAIPTRTSVQDMRPKEGTPKAGEYPYKRFRTSVAYPDGFPKELLKELDRDVAPTQQQEDRGS